MSRAFARKPRPWSGKKLQGPAWNETRRRVLARDGGRCQIRVPGKCLGAATQVDHIVSPLEGGAMFDMSNLRAACRPCNAHLGAKLGAARLAMKQNRWSRAW